jgi:mannosyltransferase OCH1-like enzyme
MTAATRDDSNAVIQGLWIGTQLSTLERLSIASFLQNGHEYHLYAYGCISNVPDGTIVKDGREILAESRIFQYRDHKSYSGFSNFFRYKLLLERGGWWVDTDTICLKPFDLPDEYVFASETVEQLSYVNCGVVKAPRDSPVMSYAWSICETKESNRLVWGEVGPKLLAESVRKLSVERFVVAPQTFCPIGYRDWAAVLDPARVWSFGDDVYAVHLWNEMWRRDGRNKEHTYRSECLYEQLKRRYLGEDQLRAQ